MLGWPTVTVFAHRRSQLATIAENSPSQTLISGWRSFPDGDQDHYQISNHCSLGTGVTFHGKRTSSVYRRISRSWCTNVTHRQTDKRISKDIGVECSPEGHITHTQLYFITNVVAEKTCIIKHKLNKLNKWSLNDHYIDTSVGRIRTQFQFLFG